MKYHHRHRLSTLLLLGLASVSTARATLYCKVGIIPDSTFPPFAYKAVLRLDPLCPPGGVAYVRKSSTINTIKKGAPYQPTIPGGQGRFGGKWSWKMTTTLNEVPSSQLWTLNLWRWEYFDGNQWRGAKLP